MKRFDQRLKVRVDTAESVLPMIVETVAQTFKLPYVAIVWKREQVLLAAAFGSRHGCPWFIKASS